MPDYDGLLKASLANSLSAKKVMSSSKVDDNGIVLEKKRNVARNVKQRKRKAKAKAKALKKTKNNKQRKTD